MSTILSPCIGACSTVYGDDYCRGCKRHVDEIADWVGYADAEKRQIIARLDQQLMHISADLFTVCDSQLLRAKLQRHKIRCDFSRTPVYWVFCLLREGRDKIRNLNQYGIQPLHNMTPSVLFAQLDQAFYQQALTGQ